MHRILSRLGLLALLAAPSAAFGYTATLSTSSSASGFNGTHNFTNLPPSTGNVTISVTQSGDFGHSSEFSTVYADGTNLGTINPTQSNINCVTESGSFTVAASYVNDGSLTVLVDASSAVDFCATISYTVTISYSESSPPTADAGGPYTVNQGLALSLDGSGSSAGTGSIALYEWDCTNNGSYDVSSTSAVASTCTYPDDGAYTVGLRVTNSGGLTDTDTASVTVTNTAPTADAGGPYTVNQGVALTMDGSGSVDPDGTISTFAWDCDNNGSYETSSASATGATCTFADIGTYTVGLQITDDDGATDIDSATVTVTNTPPVAEANGNYAGTKGVPISVDATGSGDADGTLTAIVWDCDDDGVFETSGSTASCTYNAVGTYTITVQVTDDDGDSATDTAIAVVGNDPPTADAGGPYTGAEGTTISFDGTGSTDVGSGIVVLWEWDCTTDGSYDSAVPAPAGSCVYADDGTYTMTLRVTDDDGSTATDTATVTVTNAAPTVTVTAPATGNEGAGIVVAASAADPSPVDEAALTYDWTVTDGGGATVTTGSGANPTFTFADDGTYTFTVVVTDPQGATATDAATTVVGNVDPTFTSTTAPSITDEGTTESFSVVVDDAGTGDVAGLVVTWDWGDGSPTEIGTNLVHSWDDDGAFTVTVTVTDDDGGSASQSLPLTVGNVAPVITTTAPSNALEGAVYSYLPAVTDPGDEVFTWTLSASAPAGMTIDAATGELTWTPTYDQALVGTFSFVLTVDDGDGATDAQSITVAIDTADTDGDGLADSWETANGLDPNDPSDATGDPDADGLTNLDEFGQGTDPNVYDGPSEPTLFAPIGDAEVATDRPDLVVDNATDPQNDTLLYDYEVYADAALTTLVTSMSGVVEDASGQTSWKVDVPLSENTAYWWRARANDPWVASAWTLEESFFVNAVEDAPEAPTLVFPIGGETASSATPELVWTESFDADGDLQTYEVEVWDATGTTLIASAADLAGDGLEARWTVDVTLTEDTDYSWTARATDEHGVVGPWATPESFFVDTDNAAPFDVVFVQPLDGATLASLPTLVATEGIDPEGEALEYRFEIDSAADFAAATEVTLPATGTGTVSWNLLAEGVTLEENATAYARVRAIDPGGVTSTPDTISFFLRGDNDAPSVPVLLTPEDDSETSGSVVFTIEDPVDPEDDLIYLDVVVARDAELTDVVAEVVGLLVQGNGTVEWTADAALTGDLYWSARAVDEFDAASDWAEPFVFYAPVEPAGDDDDDDDVTAGNGCNCQENIGGGGPQSAAWMLLLLGGLLVRRRRA